MLITEHRNEEAKQYLQKNRREIHLKGWMDDTPLHIASNSGNIEMVKYLIENGADVNAARNGVYAIPLCWAANYEIAQLLLAKGIWLKCSMEVGSQTSPIKAPNMTLGWLRTKFFCFPFNNNILLPWLVITGCN